MDFNFRTRKVNTVPNNKRYLKDPRFTAENLTIDDASYCYAEGTSRVTLCDTNITRSSIWAYTGDIAVIGGTHDKLKITTYAPTDIVNVHIEGDITTNSVTINPGSNVTLKGSWKLDGACFSGNLSANVESLKSDEVYKEEHYYAPMEDVQKVWADGRIGRSLFYDSFHAANTLLEGAYKVHQFCVAPEVHTLETCRCGLYYPLMLLGEGLAVLYYMLANPSLAECVSDAVSSLPKGFLEDALNALFSKRFYDTDYGGGAYISSDLEYTLARYGINAPEPLFLSD